MAATSTYISLSSSVLLEYQYRGATATTDIFTTGATGGIAGTAPWYLMNNQHDNSIALFNADQYTATTGNVRTRMGTPTDVNTAQYGYLKLDQIIALNDYDPKLTDSVNLPVVFNAQQSVKYDTVRLHLTQGFNFENLEGFQFRLSFENNNDQKVRYLNVAYRKADNYSQINPNPFLFGGKYYASYIEFKVPALYDLVNEYQVELNSGSINPDIPSVRLTGGSGPKVRSLITTEFAWIPTQKVINGQTYFNSYEWKQIDLPLLDQFADLSAVVQDAPDGDYIQLYAAWSGTIIDNFINQLNDVPGNDYIILHDLEVYEMNWPAGATGVSWIKTGNLEFVQDSNYEDPIPYRPIIQNAGSVAYRIDYTIRLFNRADNSSIWKFASYQGNDAAKYAKYLRRINLGSNPIQPKVYNQIVDKGVNFFGQSSSSSDIASEKGYSRFVTSFLTSNNVIMSSENAFIQRNPTTGQVQLTSVGNSLSETIYAQGLGKIQLTNSDTFIKFVIYKGSPETSYEFMDLTGLGTVTLNFFADSGEIKRFKKFDTSDVSEANGEIVFKVPSKDSQRISEYSSKQFTITADNGDSESQLYSGSFAAVGNENETMQERKITNLNKQIEELQNKLNATQNLLELEESSVATLKSTNQSQATRISDLQAELSEKIAQNNELLADDELDEAEKAKLKEEIASLEAANQAAQIELQNQKVITVDPNCPVSRVVLKGANIKTSELG